MEIVVLALVWLVVTAAVGVVVRARLAREERRCRGRRQPLCAACAYRLEGVTHVRCPECGVHLRIAGVYHGAARPR